MLLLRLVHLRDRLAWMLAWPPKLLIISVQKAQVTLPAYREHAREHKPIWWRDECEAECCDCRP